MDVQLFLVIILSILTFSIVIVCIYVIVILKEFKNTISKFNTTLDSVQHIKDNLFSTSSILGMISTIFETIKSVRSIRTIADYDDEDEQES